MMRKRTGVGLAAAVAGVLAALWLAMSPGWAVSAMSDAARTRDAARLATYVDAPRVKASIVEQMAAQMALVQARNGNLDPKVAVGAMNAAARMVQGVDTAQLVSGAFSGANRPETRRTGITTFTTGRDDSQGGLEFELQGVTWRVVGIRPPSGK